MKEIVFNKPYITGKEVSYISNAILDKKLSGNGPYTKKCHSFFEKKYSFKKCLLTTSGTDALEMCAILINIQPGDEVIIPSFTFVSTANAFILRGAKVVFCDSGNDHPNIDPDQITKAITSKTKAIVIVHYAGVACDMDKIMTVANANGLFVIEDAAHAIDSYYKTKPLGSIGHLAAFSFHETKNISCGEGGMLVVNDEQFIDRAEIIWEKGTNRAAFYKGMVDKYNWVDIGSSFLPSEITAAFLFAQLEHLDEIQEKRRDIYATYLELFSAYDNLPEFSLPHLPNYATSNGHMFYMVCHTITAREKLIAHLKNNQINAVFHYLSLHKSPYFKNLHKGGDLKNCDRFADGIIRLPFYFDLKKQEQEVIVKNISNFLD